MIKLEPNGGSFALTADQFTTITGLILQEGLELDYDIVEHDESNGFVWLWVHHKEGYPTRHWVDTDGRVEMSEPADWVPPARKRHVYIPSGGGFCARCDDLPGVGDHA